MKKKTIIPNTLEYKSTKWHFSPAIESGGFIFISGCTGTDKNGNISKNAKIQIRDAFLNINKSLDEIGLDFSSIVDMTTYHLKINKYFKLFCVIKDDFINEPYPAWTAIGVNELISENAIVEIKMIAKL